MHLELFCKWVCTRPRAPWGSVGAREAGRSHRLLWRQKKGPHLETDSGHWKLTRKQILFPRCQKEALPAP